MGAEARRRPVQSGGLCFWGLVRLCATLAGPATWIVDLDGDYRAVAPETTDVWDALNATSIGP
jgi:hypothetical protein